MAYVRPIELDKSRPRGTINTTIDAEVLEEFKKNCKPMTMNIVLEQLMRQFNNGDFELVYRLKGQNKDKIKSIEIINTQKK